MAISRRGFIAGLAGVCAAICGVRPRARSADTVVDLPPPRASGNLTVWNDGLRTVHVLGFGPLEPGQLIEISGSLDGQLDGTFVVTDCRAEAPR